MLMTIYFLLLLSESETLKLRLDFWKKKKEEEPSVWGAWSKWEENCSTTCGIGVRRRTRSCSYAGHKRKKRCKGNSGELKNCDTKLTCPVHGGWSGWRGVCPVSCGGGVGEMKRSCTNPQPMFGGRKCEGPSEEMRACNKQKCPDQVYTLSPSTAQLLKGSIEEVHMSYVKKEDAFVRISTNPEVSARIFEEYPDSIALWTKNGRLLRLEEDRMRLSLTELTIDHLKGSDSGAYIYSMRYAPGVVRPLTLATVVVIPTKPTCLVMERQNVSLACNGAQLTKVFGGLSRSWFYDGKEIFKFKNNSLPEEDFYEVQEARPNMTGMWMCKVEDMKTGRVWATNSVFVKVLPSPKYAINVLKYKKFLLLAVVALWASGVYIVYRINRARNFFGEYYVRREWEQLQKQRLLRSKMIQ